MVPGRRRSEAGQGPPGTPAGGPWWSLEVARPGFRGLAPALGVRGGPRRHHRVRGGETVPTVPGSSARPKGRLNGSLKRLASLGVCYLFFFFGHGGGPRGSPSVGDPPGTPWEPAPSLADPPGPSCGRLSGSQGVRGGSARLQGVRRWSLGRGRGPQVGLERRGAGLWALELRAPGPLALSPPPSFVKLSRTKWEHPPSRRYRGRPWVESGRGGCPESGWRVGRVGPGALEVQEPGQVPPLPVFEKSSRTKWALPPERRYRGWCWVGTGPEWCPDSGLGWGGWSLVLLGGPGTP